jgi:hypothetical protein
MNTSILKIPALATAIVVTVALAACGSGNEKPVADQSTATSTQPTSPTTTEALPEPITPAEKRWMARLERYSNRVQRDIELGGAVTHASMGRSAKLYAGCSRTLRWTGNPGRFEPAAKLAQRACDRLKKAADLLQQAIASSDAGGSVVSGTPEEQQFNRALSGAFEASGNAQYDLQRALERAADIEGSIES